MGERDSKVGSDVEWRADAGQDAALPDPNPRLVNGLTITDVELYQAVQVPVAAAGAAVLPRNAPLVSDRAVFVRVYVAPQPGWSARSVTAELLVGLTPNTAVQQTAQLLPTGPSQVAVMGSTFNFTLPAEQVVPGTRFGIRLTSPEDSTVADGVSHTARYPLDGTLADLGADSDDGGLDIVLVPIRYEYDGSNRLPDTSPAQLAIFEDLLLALYPISQVSLTVRQAVGWSDPPTWTGNFDFGDLNDYLSNLKVSDGAASATYYYALVQPDVTFSDYCGGSCTTGQSYLVSSPENGDFRVGGGLGYSGERWAWTLVHELGHMHGQGHAPCDVSGSDTSYPYSGGGIGVWGFDPRTRTLHDPNLYSDVMGYCDDRWISDYNFANFWDRIVAVNNLPSQKSSPSRARLLVRTLRQDSRGGWVWGRDVRVHLPTSGETRTVEVVNANGRIQRVEAPVLRDSNGGVTLLVPR